MKMNIRAFSLTCGVFWGISVFLLTWWVIITGKTLGEPTLIERVYLGFEFTPGGSLIGLGWGLVDGLVAGVLFAWLYNLIHSSIQPNAD